MKRIIKIVISIIILCVVVCILFLMVANKSDKTTLESIGGEQMMERKMTITINGEEFSASLENNETVKELSTRLPLTIEMKDLNSNEKYYYFSENLPTDAMNIGRIERGDIMLFGNDCLVVFYKSFDTSYSYTKIGRIDNTEHLEQVLGRGNVEIKFEI